MSRTLARLSALLSALVLAAGLAVGLTTSPAAAKTWQVPSPDSVIDPLVELDEYENRIAHLINKKRKARDLEPVKLFESCLDKMAERWSVHLADIGELVHRDQNKVVSSCELTWAGENLVRGTGLLPGKAVKAWMKSKPHKAVMLKKRANRIGVGTRIDGEGRVVTVLNLGDAT